MPFPSVTYTFSNSTTADATQVNQNFTDIINGISDGTKNVNISALTAAGTANLQGSVTLGASSANILTVNCSLGSSIPVQTTNAYDIGSDTFGLRSVYLGSGSSAHSTRILGASVSAAWTLTLPTSGGTNLYTLQTDGTGVTSWVAPQNNFDWAQNFSLATSVATNAMTITLSDASGSALSGSNVASFMFRNATATTGKVAITTITGNLTIVIPSGASLGTISGVNQYVYVYLVADSANELAVSGMRLFDDGSLQSCTAITSGATSKNVLYATSTHTSKPVRLIGRIQVNEATAGTWASDNNEISIFSSFQARQEKSEIFVDAISAYGGTNTAVIRWSNTRKNVGSDITLAQSAANGDSFTVNTDGVYSVSLCLFSSGGLSSAAITVNGSALTTSPGTGLTYANGMRAQKISATNSESTFCSWTGSLSAADIIRGHGGGAASADSRCFMSVTKVSSQ